MILKSTIVLFILIIACGCTNEESPKKEKDTDKDGVPDSKDAFPNQKNWCVNLTFLDDTRIS
ncbi:MAG: hypothetical protein QXT63_09330, partial [Thermoplasmata archaeon]